MPNQNSGRRGKIRRQVEIIESETEKARHGVREILDDTAPLALNLVLNDEELERTSPIAIAPALVLSPPANESTALVGN